MYLVITTVVNYQLQVPCYVATSAPVESYMFFTSQLVLRLLGISQICLFVHPRLSNVQ